jgi:hypothetical protein
MSLSGHQSFASQSFDWLTPPGWIEALGAFDLDPCASVAQPWPTAHQMWTECGLERPWDGSVWLNPPYGPPKVIEPWMSRMALHRNGVACIPARTETRCWFKYVWPTAELILFAQGRPHFHKPKSGARAKDNSGAPIALVAYGKPSAAKLYASGIDGWMVKP